MLRNIILSALLLSSFATLAQELDKSYPAGSFSGQWRTFYMATLNKGSLKDYHALASGGYLRYEFRFSKSVHIGAALYNSTNMGLQDLRIPDATTGKLSRYEEGLFDRMDLANDAIFLLGELYALVTLGRHDFKFGRMKVKSPLVNPQDGRMIPTLVEGFWYRWRPGPQHSYQLGILNRIAPRTTGEFYDIGESIGPYPSGRGIDGSPARYPGNTESDYIVLFNASIRWSETLETVFWNHFVDNISNSFYLRPSLRISPGFVLETEWLHQNRVGDGGNAIDSLRYFTPQRSDILGIRVRHIGQSSEISLAYDRTFSWGPFLSPREWGRENLFSFQKRERSEGSGDNHALVFYYNRKFPFARDKPVLDATLSLGHQWKPPLEDAALNKFAMPDYTHINLDLFWEIPALPGLKPEILLTAKFAGRDTPGIPNVIYNKVDLFHANLILNYNF